MSAAIGFVAAALCAVFSAIADLWDDTVGAWREAQ